MAYDGSILDRNSIWLMSYETPFKTKERSSNMSIMVIETTIIYYSIINDRINCN